MKIVFRFMLMVFMLTISIKSMAASCFVGFTKGDMLLTNGIVTIGYDMSDAKAVAIAAKTLAEDFGRVTGRC